MTNYNITLLKFTKGIMWEKLDKQREVWENASRKMCCVWALLYSLFSMYTNTCWNSIYILYDLMLLFTEILCTELENLFCDRVTITFYELGPLAKHWIWCNIKCLLIVTHDFQMINICKLYSLSSCMFHISSKEAIIMAR